MKLTAATAALILAFAAAQAAPIPETNATITQPLGKEDTGLPHFRIGTTVKDPNIHDMNPSKDPHIHKMNPSGYGPPFGDSSDTPGAWARRGLGKPSWLGGKGKDTDASKPPAGQTSQFQQGGPLMAAGHTGPIGADKKPPPYKQGAKDPPPGYQPQAPPADVFNRPVDVPASRPGSASGQGSGGPQNPIAPWESQGGPSSSRRGLGKPSFLGGKGKETDASNPPKGQTSQYQQGGTVGYAGYDGPIPSDKKPPSYKDASKDPRPKYQAAAQPADVFNRPVSVPASQPGAASGSQNPIAPWTRRGLGKPSFLGGKGKETDANKPAKGQTSQYQQSGTVGYAGYDGPIPSDKNPPKYGAAAKDKPPSAPAQGSGNIFNQPVQLPPSRPGSGGSNANPVAPWENQPGPSGSGSGKPAGSRRSV